MKVDKIIFAVDDNPEYQGFWEVNSEICERVLGITPILFKISNYDSDFVKSEFGYVKNVKSIDGVDTGFQAQIYRMYGTSFFKNEVCMTSDIDMLLFNKEYIDSNLKNISVEDLVIFNSDAYDESRPECDGIHSGPDRYPICYSVGKGSTFNKIINTDISFEEYCKKLQDLNLGWDTDEIYFGKCVNSQTDIKVHKLVRGYSSNFHCPNRIEKIDFTKKELHQLDLEGKINLDSFVDCHCARPFSQHQVAINNIRTSLLNESEEIYLIGCHIENKTQENYLRELVSSLESKNKKFILTSHTIVPEDLIKKSVGYVYDSINPKYKTWELENFPKFNFDGGWFWLRSPYISYGSSDYYHVGVIRLLINSINYLKNTSYKIVHWIEYDCLPNYEMDKVAKNLLNSEDFIFFGVGQRFSFNVEKVSKNFLNMSDYKILSELKDNEYLAEKLIKNKLVSGKTKTFFLDENVTNLWNRYSQNFNSTKVHWSLYDNENSVNVFLHNTSNETQNVIINVDENIHTIELSPFNWHIRDLSLSNQIKKFKIVIDEKVLVDTDLSIAENYHNIINKVEFEKR
jgi:hypothetical protein